MFLEAKRLDKRPPVTGSKHCVIKASGEHLGVACSGGGGGIALDERPIQAELGAMFFCRAPANPRGHLGGFQRLRPPK